jgi:hypothetical protein
MGGREAGFVMGDGELGCGRAAVKSVERQVAPLRPRRFADSVVRFAILLGAVLGAGCASKSAHLPDAPRKITHIELQQRLMAYADRYLSRISEATDKLKFGATDPQLRLAAHATKYYPATTVLSVAAQPDPQAALLDMLTVVTLERMVWHEGGWAIETFGPEGAEILRKAQVDVEEDIWACAGDVLTPEQLADVRQVIVDWRRDNPDNRYVSTMRFDDFAASRGAVAERAARLKRAGGGFLAPINEATDAVDQTRLWGERFLFLTGRLPRIMSWQAELLAYELTATPELQQTLKNHTAMTDAVKQFAASADALPDVLARERAALLSGIEEQAGETKLLVESTRTALAEAKPVAADVRRTAESAAAISAELRAIVREAKPLVEEIARLTGKSPPTPPPSLPQPSEEPRDGPSPDATVAVATLSGAGELVTAAPATAPAPSSAEPAPSATTTVAAAAAAKSFDIEEYGRVVSELRALVESTDTLIQNRAWNARVDEVNRAAELRVDHAGREGRALINYAFFRGMFFALFCALLAFVAAAIYRLTTRRLKIAPPAHHPGGA